MKKTAILALIIVALLVLLQQIMSPQFGQESIMDRFNMNLPQILSQQDKDTGAPAPTTGSKSVVSEESTIINVVEQSLPSVVTIGINATVSSGDSLEFDPFNPFGPFRRIPGQEEEIERNIGSGFIISEDGLVITNKHVVSFDEGATYEVLTNDQQRYEVTQIYRDPLNDLAILKIDANNLKPLPLADSSQLKLGQMAIAIGTPLGEFTNTVTTGIVSGLGRGITAGSPFESFVEQLDGVIQTDAAINPGNSGGPLLNSSGQVIGVNTAVSAEGQNIGFAIPSNVVQELITSFEARGGNFERPYIGVRYTMITERNAILNEIPEGAFITEVLEDSPADEADIQPDDIITQIDEQTIDGDDSEGLAKIILSKSIGDIVSLQIWRDGETLQRTLTLEAFNE